MDSKTLTDSLNTNEVLLKNIIGESFDIKYRYFKVPALNQAEAMIVYVSGMIDVRVIEEGILEPLMKFAELPEGKICIRKSGYTALLAEHCVFTTSLKESKSWNEICDAVLEGDTALFVDQASAALILTTRKYEGRSVSEPVTETEIKGPRDAFVENLLTNAALIRRRIKDSGLRFDNMKIGEKTKTVVSISYINSLVNDDLLKEVKSRLGRIKVDSIISSENIEELIADAPLSLFPTASSTERPDKACAALLEGRIVILTDNSPFGIIAPSVFWGFLHSTGDYYERYFVGTLIRWIRVLALFLSLSASSLYVLLTSFHQEMLPTALALKIASDRNGVPFPSVVEAFLMETILEIMKEAGLRLPRPMGEAVSIVGTLVIGEAAVSAGLVGPLLIIVVAASAISSFAIPSHNLSNAFRFIKFPILIITAFFGLFGYLAGIIVVLLNLMALRSFGTPYLAPVIPFIKGGSNDVLTKVPWWKMSKRPAFVRPKDKIRQAPGMKPKPPTKE